jgi:hypothetical protein
MRQTKRIAPTGYVGIDKPLSQGTREGLLMFKELGTQLYLVAANLRGDIKESRQIRASTAKGAAQEFLRALDNQASLFIGTRAEPKIMRFEANNGLVMFVEDLGERVYP